VSDAKRGAWAVLWSAVAIATSVVGIVFAEVPCHEIVLPIEPRSTHARSDFGMVATGSPEATEAAVKILEMGGNAVDAAVAAALTLGVADPDASGLGGMTVMVIHLATDETLVIDGTSPTPLNVNPSRLRQPKEAGAVGHGLVAVPTTLAVLDRARARYGTMDLATLIAPAIEVAEAGYRLNPVQIVWSDYYRDELLASDSLRGIAFRGGDSAGQPGEVLCRSDLARTLRRIAREGVASFYRGSIADEIEADMIRNGGSLRKADLVMYRVKEVPALHATYRGADIFTVPTPAGGPAVIEALNILETFPSGFLAGDTVARHHTLIETFRIALADRRLVSGPADLKREETAPALSKEHARKRAGLIVPDKVIADSDLYGPGNPACAPAGDSTTQVSVTDRWGNVVSLTQTLGRAWGAKVATPSLGFPYNSLLESFNIDKPQCPGFLQPLIPCPTDTAPTIVFAEDGSLLAALGTPGSDLIPSIIVNVVSNLVDRGMGLEEAVVAPRVLYGGVKALAPHIEVTAPITDSDLNFLEAAGHIPVERLHYPQVTACAVNFGGVNAVGWDVEAMTFVGVGDGRRWGSAKGPRVVADPRRWGSAMGPRVVAARE
jgi:gamma-glutamyltranspeptidase/glutathione hydrolase